MILWDLERPGPRGGLKANKKFLQRQHFDEIWHSDGQLAKEMGTRFVVLGSDKRLGTRSAFFKKYNFVHMSYTVERRLNILENLEHVGTNGWGKHRHNVLRKARFGLNIHQDNDLYIEPLRMALFAAYGLPIISETVYDSFPIKLLTANYDQLIDFCRLCLKDYLRLKELGKEIQYILCEKYNFGKVIKYKVKN